MTGFFTPFTWYYYLSCFRSVTLQQKKIKDQLRPLLWRWAYHVVWQSMLSRLENWRSHSSKFLTSLNSEITRGIFSDNIGREEQGIAFRINLIEVNCNSLNALHLRFQIMKLNAFIIHLSESFLINETFHRWKVSKPVLMFA